MHKVKDKEECKECGNIKYHYEYFCDECGNKIDNDNIIRVEYTMMSESDKNALREEEMEFCSLECIIKEIGDWEMLLDMNIRGINHNNLKRKKE